MCELRHSSRWRISQKQWLLQCYTLRRTIYLSRGYYRMCFYRGIHWSCSVFLFRACHAIMFNFIRQATGVQIELKAEFLQKVKLKVN